METIGITLQISIELHKALTALGKEDGLKMVQYIRHTLTEHVKTNWETWQDNK